MHALYNYGLSRPSDAQAQAGGAIVGMQTVPMVGLRVAFVMQWGPNMAYNLAHNGMEAHIYWSFNILNISDKAYSCIETLSDH